MRLTVLGSSGTYPLPGHPASGYVVEADDMTVWIDAGPGTFVAALKRGFVDRCDALVITHRHVDHCADVAPLLSYLRFGSERSRPLPLLAPHGVSDHLAAFVGAGPDHPFHRVFAPQVVAAGDTAHLGPLVLRFGAAVHSVPAVCVEVAASGRRVVYSGDTGPGGDLPTLAAGADVLLCEATSQSDPSEYPFHLSAREAGRTAAEAKVGRLVVTHLAPTLDPSVSVAQAAEAFGGRVEHASPGSTIQI